MARRLAAVRKAAGGKENMMPYIYEAVKVYATLGEICDAMEMNLGPMKRLRSREDSVANERNPNA